MERPKLLLSIFILSALATCGPVFADADVAPAVIRFQWEASEPGRTVEKIVTGERRTVPFQISATGKVSRVKFSILSGSGLPGIRILTQQASVQEGTAVSAVEFNVPRGMPLGRHNLLIRISDPVTEQEIGRGVIPFILIPSGLDCLCGNFLRIG